MVMEICRGGELTARLKLRRYFTEEVGAQLSMHVYIMKHM